MSRSASKRASSGLLGRWFAFLACDREYTVCGVGLYVSFQFHTLFLSVLNVFWLALGSCPCTCTCIPY